MTGCLYPARRLCPLCSARGRRITIGGHRVPGALRPVIVDCHGCGEPITQEQFGRPREYCAGCRRIRERQARSASRAAARAERIGAGR